MAHRNEGRMDNRGRGSWTERGDENTWTKEVGKSDHSWNEYNQPKRNVEAYGDPRMISRGNKSGYDNPQNENSFGKGYRNNDYKTSQSEDWDSASAMTKVANKSDNWNSSSTNYNKMQGDDWGGGENRGRSGTRSQGNEEYSGYSGGAASTVGGDRGSHGGGNRGRGGTRTPREGDWNCSDCSTSNFAFRQECFKCSTPKPGGAAGNGGSDRGAHGGGGRGRGGARTPREGDWNCPDCSASNFAFRQECFKCSTTKPGGAAGNGGSDRGAHGGGGRGRGGTRTPREGDWNCPDCSASNFAFRKECFKCSTPNPGGSGQSREYSGGRFPVGGDRGNRHGDRRSGDRDGLKRKADGDWGSSIPQKQFKQGGSDGIEDWGATSNGNNSNFNSGPTDDTEEDWEKAPNNNHDTKTVHIEVSRDDGGKENLAHTYTDKNSKGNTKSKDEKYNDWDTPPNIRKELSPVGIKHLKDSWCANETVKVSEMKTEASKLSETKNES